MKNTTNYHEDTDEKVHIDWIRVECFELALKRHPYKSIEELAKVAKDIENHILQRQPAPVIQIAHVYQANEKGQK